MLTADHIRFLRADADARKVVQFFVDNGWAAITDDQIRAIFANWAQYPAFQAQYGTLDGYLRARGYGAAAAPPAAGGPSPGGGVNPVAGAPRLNTTDFLAQLFSLVQRYPIPAAVVAYILLKRR